MSQPLFRLGRIVATPAALDYAGRNGVDVLGLLARHVRGDWGDVDAEDAETNNRAVTEGHRILSAYGESDHRNVAGLWIITEADRSVTTALRPSDY